MAGLCWVAIMAACCLAAHCKQMPLLHRQRDSPFPALNFSSTSPYIFHSIFGLLQQWPNTFFTNGHTIAPCRIAKNTYLYHARRDASFPPSPEWFAFDAEMSYAIAGMGADSHLLTYRTTREVQCLYFDGTSASLMDDGSMDSQMLLIHNQSANVPDRPAFGRPPPGNGSYEPAPCMPGSNCTGWNPLQAEYDRATGLCDLFRTQGLGGVGWGYEGIVRMNAGFELIWCSFSSPSAELVSRINVSTPLLEGNVTTMSDEVIPGGSHHSGPASSASLLIQALGDRGPPRGRRGMSPWTQHPFVQYGTFEFFHSAAKRYGFVGGISGRGESRVRIDSGQVFTFYDAALHDQRAASTRAEQVLYNLTVSGQWHAPRSIEDRAAALQTLTRRRRTQRIQNVTAADGKHMRSAVLERMREAMRSSDDASSGTDWKLATEEIVLAYSNPLHDIRKTLTAITSDMNDTHLHTRISHLREVTHGIWMPYYQYPIFDKSGLSEAFHPAAPESVSALTSCTTQYHPFEGDVLSASELVTHAAVHDVLVAICGTLLPVFLSVEVLWLANFNNVSAVRQEARLRLRKEAQGMLQNNLVAVEELMAWLGWVDQWTACSPGCGLGEVCYIPTWPAMIRAPEARGPQMGDHSHRDPHPYGRRGFGMDDMAHYLWEPICVDAEHLPP